MEIRKLTSADATAYQELRLFGLQESPNAFGSSYAAEVDRPPEVVAARLDDVRNHTFGAFAGDRTLVGIVTLRREPQGKTDHKAYVYAMYVRPEQRRQGIGRRLLEAVIAQAHELGLRQIELSVTQANRAAVLLYESCGFEQYGLERDAFRVDDVFCDVSHMVLWLRERAKGQDERRARVKRHLGPTTWLYPMPTLLVAVRTGPDSANVLTIAWGGIASGNPPTIALGIGAMHHSASIIDQVGDFTVNVPRSIQVAEVDYCGTVSGAQDPDKPTTCGWTMLPSTHVSSPYIAECPINLECRVVETIVRSTNATYLAEILATHVDEELLNARGRVDALLLDPLIWTPDGNYYRLGAIVGREYEMHEALRG
jgi:flavin reductase (DIM6/NTAB) family NADH-FMN oxidoreductase RutF/ribosomal protein S18 acetylase RimI-like enzyme